MSNLSGQVAFIKEIEHSNKPVDVLKVLKMVLIHDIVEIVKLNGTLTCNAYFCNPKLLICQNYYSQV